MVYLWIFSGLLLLLILWSSLEQRILVKSEYIIQARKESLTEEINFVVLSDLHNKKIGKNNRVLIKKILDQNPDFVIIAGDLVTKRKPCYPSNAYDLIKELSDYYPIFYGYGNHEQSFEDMSKDPNKDEFLYEAWCKYKNKLLDLGVHLLDNKSIIIQSSNNKLTITGLSLPMDYYRKGKLAKLEQDEITNKIGKRSKEGYQILIAHNPMYFKEYIGWRADLVLSGHVHGGLVRLPFIGGVISPQVRLFPKYDAGLFSEQGYNMVVSRGLGTHSYMPRFFNPPQLLVIKIKPS